MTCPPRESAFTVFAQRADARIELAEWKGYAERFLGTRLGLTADKKYDGPSPPCDDARVVLAPAREGAWPGGTRGCWGRPRTDDDLRAARSAPGAGAGLADLAARCAQVWLVEAAGEDDALALRLAAVIAGVVLGPILAPRAAALFGPKTARERLSTSGA